jgi:hypothetical protein
VQTMAECQILERDGEARVTELESSGDSESLEVGRQPASYSI